MTFTRFCLLLAGGGLALISLTYGVSPSNVLPRLADVSVEGTDQLHVYRGVMGLYLGMSLYWLMAAFRPSWARPAVLSVVFFMTGLAAGRVLSLVIDGLPSVTLVVYLLLEVGVAVLGLFALRRTAQASA